jgi:hypothetical protein
MSDNVLDVLRVADKEDVISNLLAYCIERSASFRSKFLERICGLKAAAYSDCQVHPRLQVPKAGVPDLVVVCKGERTDWAIIENKLKADEGKDQTVRYADPKLWEALSKQLQLDSSAGRPRLVFLTLFPDQVPVSEHFSRACYSSLLQSRSLLDHGDALALQLASDWLELLEEFYAFEHLDSGEVLAGKLSTMHVLDAGYLAFRSLIRSLSLPSGLAPDHFFRRSEQGRKYYGAALTKSQWKTEPFDDIGGRWPLPKGNRHIHIEPQYNVLEHTLTVYIHYETNPYHPVRKLRANAVPEQYEAYLARRDAFIRSFADIDSTPFQVSADSNQLARVAVSLSGRTVTEVLQEMQKLIGVAAEAVDQALTAESTA